MAWMRSCCCQPFEPAAFSVRGAHYFPIGDGVKERPLEWVLGSGLAFYNGGMPPFKTTQSLDESDGATFVSAMVDFWSWAAGGGVFGPKLNHFSRTHYLHAVIEWDGDTYDAGTLTPVTCRQTLTWDERDHALIYRLDEVDDATVYEYSLADSGTATESGDWSILASSLPNHVVDATGTFTGDIVQTASASSLTVSGDGITLGGSATSLTATLEITITLSDAYTVEDALDAAEVAARTLDVMDLTTSYTWEDTANRTIPEQIADSKAVYLVRYLRELTTAGTSSDAPVFGAIALVRSTSAWSGAGTDPWTEGFVDKGVACSGTVMERSGPFVASPNMDPWCRYWRAVLIKDTNYLAPVDELHHYSSLHSETNGTVTQDPCGSPGANGATISEAHSLDWVLYDPSGSGTAGTGEAALPSENVRGLQTTDTQGFLRLQW